MGRLRPQKRPAPGFQGPLAESAGRKPKIGLALESERLTGSPFDGLMNVNTVLIRYLARAGREA
jgi:hypothetical protein